MYCPWPPIKGQPEPHLQLNKVRFITYCNGGEHTMENHGSSPEEAVKERHRIWACFLGAYGKIQEIGLCSGLEAVRKQS